MGTRIASEEVDRRMLLQTLSTSQTPNQSENTTVNNSRTMVFRLITASDRFSTLAISAHGQFHQVIHERLQTNIVGEDGLCRLTDTAVRARRVRCRRIELGEQETGLRTAGVTDDETGQREAVLDEFLGDGQ